MKLHRRYVEKPWGRTRLPSMFDAPVDRRIGEVWFTNGRELPLLAKYIFTSERLSIQVHPPQKTECWYVLEAEPGATIALGLTREISRDELREAALDGSIERLVDWRPVHDGDFFIVPPGTIHAIGAGVSLLEFQQNADLTYRLYDYGRPRELHVDDAIRVADPVPYAAQLTRHVSADEERALSNGPAFELILTRGDALQGRQRWVMPLDGEASAAGDVAAAGECLLLSPEQALQPEGARMLIGAMPKLA